MNRRPTTPRRFISDGTELGWNENGFYVQIPPNLQDQGRLLMTIIGVLVSEVERQDAELASERERHAADKAQNEKCYRMFSEQLRTRSADGLQFHHERKMAFVHDSEGRPIGLIEQTFTPEASAPADNH